jgi:hypothetical protein
LVLAALAAVFGERCDGLADAFLSHASASRSDSGDLC